MMKIRYEHWICVSCRELACWGDNVVVIYVVVVQVVNQASTLTVQRSQSRFTTYSTLVSS
jgi:hypothetical protein